MGRAESRGAMGSVVDASLASLVCNQSVKEHLDYGRQHRLRNAAGSMARSLQCASYICIDVYGVDQWGIDEGP